MNFLKKQKLILVLVLFALIATSIIFSLSRTQWNSEVVVNGKTIIVEVADTPHLLEKGLSGHAPLATNTGMLFIFEQPAKYGFWMKDMTFSIDIIWIDENLKVVHIEKSLSPETYPTVYQPSSPALYVLEISSGWSNALNLKIGDTVKLGKKWL